MSDNALHRVPAPAEPTRQELLARIAELEASRDHYRTAGDSATLRASQLTERNNYQSKRIAELEAELDEITRRAVDDGAHDAIDAAARAEEREARRTAVLAEREACAKIADRLIYGRDIATDIRARPTP